MPHIIDNRVYHKVMSFSCVDTITIHDCQFEVYVEDDDDLQSFCGMLPLVVNDWTPLLEYVTIEIIDLLHFGFVETLRSSKKDNRG